MAAAAMAVAVHAQQHQQGCNLLLNGLCWADRHVGTPGAFAADDGYSYSFYRFNRRRGWEATGEVKSWRSATVNESYGWLSDSSPCPKGWRLPLLGEYRALSNGSQPIGGVWAAAGERGNEVPGKFFGPNANTCSLPNNMEGCAFFPASGYRNLSDGGLRFQGSYGYGWSSTQAGATIAYFLGFNCSGSNPGGVNKAYAFPVRCVRWGLTGSAIVVEK